MLIRDLYESFRARVSLAAQRVRIDAAESKARLAMAEALADDIENIIVDPYEGTEGWQGSGADPRDVTLAQIEHERLVVRQLCGSSGIAESALDSVADYVAGTGFSYTYTVPKGGNQALKDLATLANEYWMIFAERERMPDLERGFVRAADRDGESFLRIQETKLGVTVRYLDPTDVIDESGKHQWGIEGDGEDQQRPTKYYVRGESEAVDAADVLHVKLNVDADLPRGRPTLYPVRARILSAERILKAVGSLAEVQAKFAVVHKLAHATAGVDGKNFLETAATKTATDAKTGISVRQRRMVDGSMVTISPGQEIIFPTSGLSIASFPPAFWMQCRAIAVRLGIPDFALTGDPGGANFASMFVGMAPSAKRLGTKQALIIRRLTSLHRRVLEFAVQGGELPAACLVLGSSVAGPEVSNRDEVSQTNVREVLFRNRILSGRTWAAESGYDYDEERRNQDNDEDEEGGIDELPTDTPAQQGTTGSAPQIGAAVIAAQTKADTGDAS